MWDPDDPEPSHHHPGYPPDPRYPHCPQCQSQRVKPRHRARKIGSAIGTIAGAATLSMRVGAAAHVGAGMGSRIASVVGPTNPWSPGVGAIAGAILGAMAGAAAGCSAGAALGSTIDANVLDNHHCLACGHCFCADVD